MSTGSLSADTWTKIIKTIPGNSNLTFNNDTGVGPNIYLLPFAGTSYTNSVDSITGLPYNSGYSLVKMLQQHGTQQTMQHLKLQCRSIRTCSRKLRHLNTGQALVRKFTFANAITEEMMQMVKFITDLLKVNVLLLLEPSM